MMKNAIVDLIHTAPESDFETERILIPDKFYVVHLVNDPTVLFFLYKKGCEFVSNTKYQFINHCEKSFELIHPSILNIVGFSLEKPYLYYYYFESHKSIDSSISDVNIQKIFFGIASGLSYLLSKGYYCSDFSISSVIFDRDYCPKLFDYINIEEPNENYENDLIRRYADVVNFIINEKMKENSNLKINEEFQDLLRRANQTMNLPSFIEFINFFQTKNYCTNVDVINTKSFEEYLSIFKYVDKIIYEGKSYFNNPKEEIYRYFYFTYSSFNSLIDSKAMIYLNSLTDNDIKKISAFYKPLSYLEKFLVYEDLSLIIPDWTKLVQKHSDKNPFKIYNELMKHIKILENEKKEIIHLINKKEQIEHKIDALRIQAIFYLKKAYKMPNNNVKIKIELATQYVNGSLLPYNLTKAINILKEINDADKSTQKLINQMIEKIESVIQSSSIKKVLENIPQEQREIYKKATEGENILSLLFCGFAFYCGFNGFPIMHILSIQFYRKAAKKSAHAMTLLGQLYLKGIIFPQNFQRAKNCFRRASEKGDDKADILDCLLRRHIWRRHLMRFDENIIIRQYLPSLNTPYRCIIPLLISRTENYTIQRSSRYFYAEFKVVNDKLHSERINENSGTFLGLQSSKCYNKMKEFDKIYHAYNSLLSDEDIENTKCVNEQMFLAKSYYYGIAT